MNKKIEEIINNVLEEDFESFKKNILLKKSRVVRIVSVRLTDRLNRTSTLEQIMLFEEQARVLVPS